MSINYYQGMPVWLEVWAVQLCKWFGHRVRIEMIYPGPGAIERLPFQVCERCGDELGFMPERKDAMRDALKAVAACKDHYSMEPKGWRIPDEVMDKVKKAMGDIGEEHA